jgi:hypothetical protein
MCCELVVISLVYPKDEKAKWPTIRLWSLDTQPLTPSDWDFEATEFSAVFMNSRKSSINLLFIHTHNARFSGGGTPSAATDSLLYSTNSNSPGRQVLSNQDSPGPYKRRSTVQPFPSTVCIQFRSFPFGALGPK